MRQLLTYSIGLCLTFAIPASAQQNSICESSEIVSSAELPPGTIRGVVVDASDGTPLAEALVYVKGERGTATDAKGWFELSGVTIGDIELTAEALGYLTESIAVSVDPSAGHLLRFALSSVSLGWGCEGEYVNAPAIQVLARDVLTGRAPSGSTKLVVQEGMYTDSALVELDRPGGEWVELTAARRRPGTYSVLVVNSGYLSWRADGVVAELSDCTSNPMRTISVWLLER
ncbi:MAG: hypothetical protein GTO46_11500 [Gemmatimonadetes bacterium]|nr:hypothetical protein [Gemmatimonadota bacterium]